VITSAVVATLVQIESCVEHIDDSFTAANVSSACYPRCFEISGATTLKGLERLLGSGDQINHNHIEHVLSRATCGKVV
jgi:hypothetical protein